MSDSRENKTASPPEAHVSAQDGPDRKRASAIFVSLSVSFGLLFSFLTPPYQAPDEAAHFFRAFSLAEGQVFLLRDAGRKGDLLPESLPLSKRAFDPLAGNAAEKITRARLVEELRRPTNESRRTFVDLGPTAVYSPVTHLAQAIGIALAQAFDASVLGSLYAARVANVLVTSAIIGLAIYLLPFLRWGVAFLALLPMAVFLRASVSGDPISTALAFLLFALILHLAWSTDALSIRIVFALFVLTILLALTKPVYCSIVLLTPIIGLRRFSSRRAVLVFYIGVIAALACGAALFMTWLSASAPPPTINSTVSVPSPIDPGAQLALGIEQPLVMLRTIFTDFVVHAPRYLAHFIGRLGWLDTPLPTPLLGAYALALLFIALTGGDPRLAIPARSRLLALVILTGTTAAISVTMYAVWTAVGAATVEGIQGRYFHPIAPLVLLVLANRRLALRGRVEAWFPAVFAAFNAGGLTITAFVIVTRYYE